MKTQPSPVLPSPAFVADAAKEAKRLIEADFGTLSDLPLELRDAIANVYLRFCAFRRLGPGGRFALSNLKGRDFVVESAFYTCSVEALPELIRLFREKIRPMGQQKSDFAAEVYILMFKYRIPNMSKRSLLTARILKMFYRANAREVQPGLYDAIMFR